MNFYKKPLPDDKRFKYWKIEIGDKYIPANNLEEECNEMKNELLAIGVKSRIGCNNGMWSVAITEISADETFLRMACFVDSRTGDYIGSPWH